MQRSVAHRRFGKNTGNNFPPERSGAPDFLARKCDWRIRDKIEAVLPICQGYNARIKAPGGFHLINTARERIWKIASGKANFAVFPGIQEDEYQSNPDPLWLMTLRSHDQYNTTLYANNDRYRGVYNQRDIGFLNDMEMRKRGLTANDRVDVRTLCSDGIERMLRGFKIVPYNIPDGSCAAYFPEANVLAPLSKYDPLSGTQSSKAVP